MHSVPICVFTYNRFDEFRSTIEKLMENIGSSEYTLYVFIDGPKNETDKLQSQSIYNYACLIDHFKSVIIRRRPSNYGLARSIIGGVSELLEEFDSVIVLEDDLLTSRNFLSYMTQALHVYKNNQNVWSISGFSFPITYPGDCKFDAVFGVRASSWGWATWKDRWAKVDWEVSDYQEFLNDRKARHRFNKGGSDMCKMLHDQMTGKINSWAIRFCYAQFRNNGCDLYPTVSKVQNIGFTDSATNTGGMNSRFKTSLDNSSKVKFLFPEEVDIDSKLLVQFRKPFSLLTRIKYKLINLLK